MILDGADLVFITSGMGGGTGTGAAAVVAELGARIGRADDRRDHETVRVRRTRKCNAGGRTRHRRPRSEMRYADHYSERADPADHREETPLNEAFLFADDVLRQGIQGISDLITQPGLINLDFADVKTIMTDAGSVMTGIGEGTGEHRAADARKAIASPLLETTIEARARRDLQHHRRPRSVDVRSQRSGRHDRPRGRFGSADDSGVSIDPALQGRVRSRRSRPASGVRPLRSGVRSPARRTCSTSIKSRR